MSLNSEGVYHPQRLLDGIRACDKRSLARAISFVENDPWQSRSLINQLYLDNMLGRADIIGITGPPGAGKSTLTGKLIKHLRAQDKTVGVVLIDPSSPFTGGAILGDRVRMSESNTDPGVFIRSMGSRGHLGGLALATQDTVALMDAYGFDIILIETVGIGQAETEIVATADMTIVIAVPGLGDEIQIIKAGIMEIGDIFVVNKADRDGASKVATEIKMMLDMVQQGNLRPVVLNTIANRDQGIEELMNEIFARLTLLNDEQIMIRRRENRLWQTVAQSLQSQVAFRLNPILQSEAKNGILERIKRGESSPYQEAQVLLTQLAMLIMN